MEHVTFFFLKVAQSGNCVLSGDIYPSNNSINDSSDLPLSDKPEEKWNDQSPPSTVVP